MKKIAFYLGNLSSSSVPNLTLQIINGLDRNRYIPVVIVNRKVPDEQVPLGSKILYLHTDYSIGFKQVFLFLRRVYRLSRILGQERPDLLFTGLNRLNICAFVAVLISRIRCRIVITEHTAPYTELKTPISLLWKTAKQYPNDSFLINLLYFISNRCMMVLIRLLYPSATTIICVSKGISSELQTHFGIKPSRLKVIYNSIDPEKIRSQSRVEIIHPRFDRSVPIIITAGRLTRQKDHLTLLRAFATIRSHHQARLIILGEGEYRPLLEDFIQTLHLQEDVWMPGHVENPFAYFSLASVFVLSSIYEGFVLVILEAFASGIPVVSTDCPCGTSEIIQSERNGLLVPVGNDTMMAKAIIRILQDQPFSQRLTDQAGKTLTRFSQEDYLKAYYQVFDSLVLNPSSPV